jgi:hypothetical protein
MCLNSKGFSESLTAEAQGIGAEPADLRESQARFALAPRRTPWFIRAVGEAKEALPEKKSSPAI